MKNYSLTVPGTKVKREVSVRDNVRFIVMLKDDFAGRDFSVHLSEKSAILAKAQNDFHGIVSEVVDLAGKLEEKSIEKEAEVVQETKRGAGRPPVENRRRSRTIVISDPAWELLIAMAEEEGLTVGRLLEKKFPGLKAKQQWFGS
jgi:hypothetical protein